MILNEITQAPNPQFARLPFHDLTGAWTFAFDDDDRGIAERWFGRHADFERSIEVPYPPESALSGVHDTGFHPICWYARTFTDPRADQKERLVLRFGAVDYEATVWVDGIYVGSHVGGSTPFSLDITDALDPAASDHVVTVRVHDEPEDVEQPRGKQGWHAKPRGIFYERTTGIWQPVWLESAPLVCIEDIRWTFDQVTWSVGVEISLNRAPIAESEVTVELEHEGQTRARATWLIQGRQISGSFDLRSYAAGIDINSLLWSPEHPTLLGARVTLRASGQPTDVVLGYTGLRTVSIDERGVIINGVPTYLRLVLSQGYWSESHLAAPSPDAIRREVELILALGFNGARLHQKIEDPRFLYHADTLGLLLWGEIGSAFTWSDRAIARHAQEWREAVVRDRNHPSIIAWVPFNESWGIDEVGYAAAQQHAVRAIYHATHALDGSRPVIGNDGWENVAGDIITAHDYSWSSEHLERLYGSDSTPEYVAQHYAVARRRLVVEDFGSLAKPIILTEFGGVSYAPSADDEDWYGYGSVRSDEEFIDTYRRLVEAVAGSSLLAGFCYTQLTDTLQETNGLLTDAREPKVDMEELRSITSGQPAKA